MKKNSPTRPPKPLERLFPKLAPGFALGILLLPQDSHAATIDAASCSNEDVQSAINSASDGDVVEVPACPSGVSWDDGYMVDDLTRCHAPAWACAGIIVPGTKGLTVRGQGLEQTVIVTDIAIAIWADTSDTNSQVVVAGFDFRLGVGHTDQGVIVIQGQAKDWRVHHNRFGTASEPYTHRAFWVGHVYGDCTYGLWDHNEHHAFESGVGVVSMGGCDGGGNFGDNVWTAPLDWGSADWMFFEDNAFYGYGEIGHGAGGPDNLGAARIVFRHNAVDDTYPTHGAESGGRPRGHRASDIYDNTFAARTDNPCPISLRAGTFRIHDNTIAGPYQRMGNVWLANWDNSRGDPYGNCRDAPAEGLCSGDYETACVDDGECSGAGGSCEWVHDVAGSTGGNEDGMGYPCRDQPGRGLDTGVTSPQQLEPIFSWNNSGPPTDLQATTGGVTENVDFYNCVDYDDCLGNGMPAYATYPYPHPLQGAGGGGGTGQGGGATGGSGAATGQPPGAADDDGGCGCRLGSVRRRGVTGWAALAAGLLMLLRRRARGSAT